MQTTPAPQSAMPSTVPVPVTAADYAGTAVAFIYGNTPITRQDFGEYLIERQTNRLFLLINKRIIEHECEKRGITVTDAEIDQAMLLDLGRMQIQPRDFLKSVLKRYNMTFFEYRQDVVRPQLMMGKYAGTQVTVDDKDLLEAYEAEFGEKMDVRLIVVAAGMADQDRTKLWERIRNNEKEFAQAALTQPDPELAQVGGRLNGPLSRHSLTDSRMEKELFALEEGQVSAIYQTGDRFLIFKCDRHIPPVPDKDRPPLTAVAEKYRKTIREVKARAKIPEVFNQWKEDAVVKSFMTPSTSDQDWLHMAEETLGIKHDDRDKMPDIEALKNQPPAGTYLPSAPK
jgi:hypothetical protein